MGRWINRDPIEERGGIVLRGKDNSHAGGLNHYSQVQNDPIGSVDPFGLWDYKGYCRYISGGEVVGVGSLRCFEIWTKCRPDKTREVAELQVILGGLTAGIPGGWVHFNLELDDVEGKMVDVSLERLEGFSKFTTFGAAIGPVGASYYEIKIGKGIGGWSLDWQAGIADASVDKFWGYSYLRTEPETRCCNPGDMGY